MQTKMIFLDIDGTLVNDKKELPKKNKEAIDAALNMGHKVFICTGRPLSSVTRLLPIFGLERPGCYAITYNGGLIYDAYAKKPIYKKTLTMDQVKYIFDKARELNIHAQTYTDECFICEEDNEVGDYYARVGQIEKKVVEDIFAELNGQEPCKVLCMAHGHDHAKLEAFRESLEKWSDGLLDVCFSCSEFLEFMPYGINKGNAIRYMSEFLNIPMENTIACGDAENDITMLKAAAVGAVMKNAGDDIKQYGNYITEYTNNEAGVAEVIEKFMLQQ